MIRLTRDSSPTLGVLLADSKPILLTLEPPNLDNIPKRSCIPLGVYSCERVFNRTTSGGLKIERTIEVKNVPGRSGILFHIGNTVKDTEGCILLGQRFSYDFMERAILDSKKAFIVFESLLNRAPKDLTVEFLACQI